MQVVHNGFYMSMEALRGATYEELVDSGVRPVHAKLIISHLGSRNQPFGASLPAEGGEGDGQGEEVATFLRSVGLENCLSTLLAAGYTSLDALGEAGMQELLAAGLKPVHARLIVSNLDSASTAGINMTPANQRVVSLDEESLLGGGAKKQKPKRARLYVGVALLLALLLWLGSKFVTPSAPPPPPAKHHEGRPMHGAKLPGMRKLPKAAPIEDGGAPAEGGHAATKAHAGSKGKGKQSAIAAAMAKEP